MTFCPKNYLLACLVLFGTSAARPSLATSGTCSYHGGVNCYAGADYDGSVICNDGWRDSSVQYSAESSCDATVSTQCTYPIASGCTTETDYSSLRATVSRSGLLGSSMGDSQLIQCRQQIDSYSAQMATYNSCTANLTSSYTSVPNAPTCGDGYLYYQGRCELKINICNSQYGPYSNVSADGSSCVCMSGYTWDKNDQCVNYDTYCKSVFGQYSMSSGESCKCAEGYAINEAFQCALQPVAASAVTAPPAPSLNQTNTTTDFVSEQIALQTAPNQVLINKLKGRILLQVQTYGAAWYLHPVTLKRYYLKDGPTAYEMLRAFGLGVSEADYARIAKGDFLLKTRLKGRIILRAQAHGEAYYINPKDLGVTYLKDGEAAYRAMRLLSLGITNADLSRVPIEMFTPIGK